VHTPLTNARAHLAAGILAGMWLVRFFQCRYEKYNWQGLSQLPTLGAKAKRSVQQLLPYSWDSYQWMTFRSARLPRASLLLPSPALPLAAAHRARRRSRQHRPVSRGP
jgi:hypothetical protein